MTTTECKIQRCLHTHKHMHCIYGNSEWKAVTRSGKIALMILLKIDQMYLCSCCIYALTEAIQLDSINYVSLSFSCVCHFSLDDILFYTWSYIQSIWWFCIQLHCHECFAYGDFQMNVLHFVFLPKIINDQYTSKNDLFSQTDISFHSIPLSVHLMK